MRKIKDGNVIYLVRRDSNCMKLRCNNCEVEKFEDEIIVEEGLYKCQCGCSTFTPQIDLEEYYI